MQVSMIKDVLKNQGWQFTEVKGKNIFLFGMTGKNGNFQCVIDLYEEESRLMFFSVCGANTPIEQRGKMLEFLNAVNYQLFLGNFEMDLEDGEIRFRTSFSYKNLAVSNDFIEELILFNLVTMDKNLPSIMGLMFDGWEVEKAIQFATQED